MDHPEQRRVRLIYPPALVDQPLIYGLIRGFDLAVNIRRAHVEADEAWLIVELQGPADRLADGLNWIQNQGVTVEVIEE